MKKSVFEVDVAGFGKLLEGKPRYYIFRELFQNAVDENVEFCKVNIRWEGGKIYGSVEDDSPEGFRNMRDAYTLFGDTYKRKDPLKRGKYNLGEKQAIALCLVSGGEATISTTKGTVHFSRDGREESEKKRDCGSVVALHFHATKADFEETMEFMQSLIAPDKIVYSLNGEVIPTRRPVRAFEATLTTEFEMEHDGKTIFRRTQRKTSVSIYIPDPGKPAFLYELGIPVCPIECRFSVDVQQKVPLNTDRDAVPEAYLKDLYAEVLNHTVSMLKDEDISASWVHTASEDDRVNRDALQAVIEKRYGDKVLVATPGDPQSVDEALSNGYRVIFGSELSKDEWANFKKFNSISSTSEKFGTGTGRVDEEYTPTESMKRVGVLAKKIAKEVFNISISVAFVNMPFGNPRAAEFGSLCLTFNVRKLGVNWFANPIHPRVLSLLYHEIAHYKGMHTESSYLDAIAEIGGKMTEKALTDPDFFKL